MMDKKRYIKAGIHNFVYSLLVAGFLVILIHFFGFGKNYWLTFFIFYVTFFSLLNVIALVGYEIGIINDRLDFIEKGKGDKK